LHGRHAFVKRGCLPLAAIPPFPLCGQSCRPLPIACLLRRSRRHMVRGTGRLSRQAGRPLVVSPRGDPPDGARLATRSNQLRLMSLHGACTVHHVDRASLRYTGCWFPDTLAYAVLLGLHKFADTVLCSFVASTLVKYFTKGRQTQSEAWNTGHGGVAFLLFIYAQSLMCLHAATLFANSYPRTDCWGMLVRGSCTS